MGKVVVHVYMAVQVELSGMSGRQAELSGISLWAGRTPCPQHSFRRANQQNATSNVYEGSKQSSCTGVFEATRPREKTILVPNGKSQKRLDKILGRTDDVIRMMWCYVFCFRFSFFVCFLYEKKKAPKFLFIFFILRCGTKREKTLLIPTFFSSFCMKYHKRARWDSLCARSVLRVLGIATSGSCARCA